MKFAPLIEKIPTVTNASQLRTCFIENAGKLVGASAWGIDLLDSRFQVIASDCQGLSEAFRERYLEVGRSVDHISRWMIQHQVPIHNLSLHSQEDWQQTKIYQYVLRGHGIEHCMAAPLIGSSGLIGGIYFMRGNASAAFNNIDLIQLSTLCQHLSVRLANFHLQFPGQNIDCLTPREREIAEFVAKGLSNREIASRLHVSRDAVKQGLKRMFRKLEVSARAEMVAKLSKQ